ncbi:fibrous sheath CABYR-binding protein-like isoform X23 [Heliangelus exortis]|uniref:fibrous sheath CABYR-binding protein-like isoform X23 n=1 Tax=Heliangelus exortis TaxID=472823 RepID=UPI003A906D40
MGAGAHVLLLCAFCFSETGKEGVEQKTSESAEEPEQRDKCIDSEFQPLPEEEEIEYSTKFTQFPSAASSVSESKSPAEPDGASSPAVPEPVPEGPLEEDVPACEEETGKEGVEQKTPEIAEEPEQKDKRTDSEEEPLPEEPDIQYISKFTQCPSVSSSVSESKSPAEPDGASSPAEPEPVPEGPLEEDVPACEEEYGNEGEELKTLEFAEEPEQRDSEEESLSDELENPFSSADTMFRSVSSFVLESISSHGSDGASSPAGPEETGKEGVEQKTPEIAEEPEQSEKFSESKSPAGADGASSPAGPEPVPEGPLEVAVPPSEEETGKEGVEQKTPEIAEEPEQSEKCKDSEAEHLSVEADFQKRTKVTQFPSATDLVSESKSPAGADGASSPAGPEPVPEGPLEEAVPPSEEETGKEGVEQKTPEIAEEPEQSEKCKDSEAEHLSVEADFQKRTKVTQFPSATDLVSESKSPAGADGASSPAVPEPVPEGALEEAVPPSEEETGKEGVEQKTPEIAEEPEQSQKFSESKSPAGADGASSPAVPEPVPEGALEEAVPPSEEETGKEGVEQKTPEIAEEPEQSEKCKDSEAEHLSVEADFQKRTKVTQFPSATDLVSESKSPAGADGASSPAGPEPVPEGPLEEAVPPSEEENRNEGVEEKTSEFSEAPKRRDSRPEAEEQDLSEEVKTQDNSKDDTQCMSVTSGTKPPPASDGASSPAGPELAYVPTEPAQLAAHVLGSGPSLCSSRDVGTSMEILPEDPETVPSQSSIAGELDPLDSQADASTASINQPSSVSLWDKPPPSSVSKDSLQAVPSCNEAEVPSAPEVVSQCWDDEIILKVPSYVEQFPQKIFIPFVDQPHYQLMIDPPLNTEQGSSATNLGSPADDLVCEPEKAESSEQLEKAEQVYVTSAMTASAAGQPPPHSNVWTLYCLTDLRQGQKSPPSLPRAGDDAAYFQATLSLSKGGDEQSAPIYMVQEGNKKGNPPPFILVGSKVQDTQDWKHIPSHAVFAQKDAGARRFTTVPVPVARAADEQTASSGSVSAEETGAKPCMPSIVSFAIPLDDVMSAKKGSSASDKHTG